MMRSRKMADFYGELLDDVHRRSICEAALDQLDVRYRLRPADLDRVPSTGPVVVVANHPFGMLEGLILMEALARVRPDVRVVANSLLSLIPEMGERCIFVDPFGTPESRRGNLNPLRQAFHWVRDGGLLVVFPAGEVARRQLPSWSVVEAPWNQAAARIIQRTGATAVPIYFHGTNGAMFHALGLINQRLSSMLLFHELLRKRGAQIELEVGNPLPPSKLRRFGTSDALTDYLKQRTELLRWRPADPDPTRAAAARAAIPKPLIPPVPAADMLADLSRLGADQRLAALGEMEVYCASAEQIPYLLREIGRLREQTFRAVGEGTGQELDIDRFDELYTHLFVWHAERRELVGAYRLGPTDELARRGGADCLYTASLFRFRPLLLEQLRPALELGRSFVRQEYQRSPPALMLLWKGIGAYVVRNPRYKQLFGPVSISADYQTASQQLMVEFLSANRFLASESRLVRPRHAFKARRRIPRFQCDGTPLVANIDEVSELVADIENDDKGVPILLKQYLRLGGKLLAFNVDPAFGNVVDGLVLMDLTAADPRVLEKYMGRAGASAFLRYHDVPLRGGRRERTAATEPRSRESLAVTTSLRANPQSTSSP